MESGKVDELVCEGMMCIYVDEFDLYIISR